MLRSPVIVREPAPPLVKVRVEVAVLPYVSDLIVTAPVVDVIEGWNVIAACPICTSSAELGGVLGVPLIVVQFAAVLHSVLVPPVQRTVPAPSNVVTETSVKIIVRRKKTVDCFIRPFISD